ncbi:hypothetical protein B0T19DRAFT_446604 [Cercophora scortea]|uniref:Uncharacterized protein n=1 Tax=Cercophora scortea TaxID=314031 RepID=A0AAE0I3E0_9PEZI|nr:hypothetical protein B0T19DRAFT_446604 [Cercophora scortea]
MSPGQFTSPLADNGYSASDQGHFQPSHSASAFDSARNLTHPPQVDNVSSATSYIHHQPRTHSALQRPSSNPDHYYQQPQELKLPGNDPRNPYVQDSTNLATQAFGQPIIPSPSSAPSSIFNETTIPSSSESWTSEQDSLVREWKKKHKTHEEISAELRRRFGVRKNSNMISKRYAKLRDKSVSKDLLEQVLTKLAPLFSSIVDDELSKVGLGLGLGLGLGREPAGDRDEQAITAAAYQEASRIMKMRGALHKHVQSCVLEGAGTDEPAIQSSERS